MCESSFISFARLVIFPKNFLDNFFQYLVWFIGYIEIIFLSGQGKMLRIAEQREKRAHKAAR